MQRCFFILFCSLSILALSSCSSKTATGSLSPSGLPELSQEEIATKMKEASTPGSEHKAIYPLVGKWKARTKWWMSPETEAEVSTATSERELVLNGLFIQEQYSSKNSSLPFEGVGMIGYDKARGEYNYTWYDTMSSATWMSYGQMDPSGKKILFRGQGVCPMTGAKLETHSELELVDTNTNILRMYMPGPDGKEFQNMEIVFKRML